MNEPTPAPVGDGRRELARSIGLAAFVYGYPLVETIRTCRLQTHGGSDEPARAPIDRLHAITRASTDRDRDIVTPANDLLYTTGWIHLKDGARRLQIPAASRHPGRYFVLALYDAYTENFANVGPRDSEPTGETVVLVGPNGTVPVAWADHRVVRSPTDLVWLIARILVGDEDDLPAARALQAEIRLDADGEGHAPASVANWTGEPIDAMAEAHELGRPAAEVAPRFFRHLAQALAEAPGRLEDAGLVHWFGQAGLRPDPGFEWSTLEPAQQAGLIDGFAEAVALVATAARSRRARPWVLASRAGRYGSDYLTRALTAYIGLGALATDEAIYGAGHFDRHGEKLDGRRCYRLRFEADDLPPAEAFWSVTLYGADRFLHPNALGRHSIGDRTPGLHREADGALVLEIGAAEPAVADNWLPAPAGPFYLILRLYHPKPDVRTWRVPALEPMEDPA